jgi:hypothetical protein
MDVTLKIQIISLLVISAIALGSYAYGSALGYRRGVEVAASRKSGPPERESVSAGYDRG